MQDSIDAINTILIPYMLCQITSNSFVETSNRLNMIPTIPNKLDDSFHFPTNDEFFHFKENVQREKLTVFDPKLLDFCSYQTIFIPIFL